MNIDDILTEIEYTKERSTKELIKWFTLKCEELSEWCQEHSETKALRGIKNRSHRLYDKFAHELTPFAYYVKTQYSNKPRARFKPCCGSEPYDGRIIDNGDEIFVEITNTIDGEKWSLQKELLEEYGHSPGEHGIYGVKNNKTKKKRGVSDIETSNECVLCSDVVFKRKILIKKRVSKKCFKSREQKLPYGQNKTILIVTFDETGFRKKDLDDLVDFKRTELESMKHKFRKIILFGWLDKKFID